MIQDIDLTNFTAGELSPRLKGRFDVAKYFNGCETLRNFVVMPQGGATARPGTMFVTKPPDQTDGERLIPFIFSTLQAYVIGFGATYARFYANDAVVVSAGVPVQIATPYLAADIPNIGFVQSFDTLFLLNRSYLPQQLTRTAATTFSIAPMVFRDGPYQPVNTTTTTLTPSGTTGSITLTASSTAGINSNAGFAAGDVGRFIRLKLRSVWTWSVITVVNSSTVVTVTVQPSVANGAWGQIEGAPWLANYSYIPGAVVKNGANFYECATAGISAAAGGPSGTTTLISDGTVQWNYLVALATATVDWRLSKWCAANGWPGLAMFWQNRLCLLSTLAEPNVIEGSVTADFTNFAPTQADGSVTDINAFGWSISDDQVNAIHWVSPAGSAQAMQLGIGTSGGEDILQAATTSAALTPVNVQAYRETALGSIANVRPARIGKSVLFFNRTGRKLHEWTFTWMVNGYQGPDLAVMAEHITRPVPSPADVLGIVEIAYQQSPHSILWCRRSDGVLIGLTYLKDQEVVAWHQHQLGGQFFGGAPRVESLAVIPSPNGGYDELWLEVLRSIGGIAVRTVEVMTPYFEGISPDQAWFVDCGLRSILTYPAAQVTPAGLTVSTDPDRPPTFTGAGVLTTGSAIFSAANVKSLIRINGGKCIVTAFVSAMQVQIQVLEPLTSQAAAAANAWSMSPAVSAVSGLDHLDGEAVAILGDGQVNPRQTVAGGVVALQSPASLVVAGLPYTPALVTMPFEPQRAMAASSSGKLKRVSSLWLRFYETLGGTFGVRQVDPMTFVETVKTEKIEARLASMSLGQGTPLFSGVRKLPALGGYDREQRLLIVQTEPLPITLLAMSARANVEEIMPQ